MLAVVVLLSACGESTVGSGIKFGTGTSGQAALGDPTPSPTPATHPTVAAPTQAPAPTHAPTITPTRTPQAAHFAIGIWSDTSGHQQFDPNAARVYTGTIITFTNHDPAAARSVVEADHTPPSFQSPMIPPGGTWNYTASTPGTFNYHDGTRPYAVASFQVVSP